MTEGNSSLFNDPAAPDYASRDRALERWRKSTKFEFAETYAYGRMSELYEIGNSDDLSAWWDRLESTTIDALDHEIDHAFHVECDAKLQRTRHLRVKPLVIPPVVADPPRRSAPVIEWIAVAIIALAVLIPTVLLLLP